MDLASNSISLGQKPALIVVDVIRGFTDPDCALGHECSRAVSVNRSLLAVFRDLNLPIFFTTVVYTDASQARVFRAKLPSLNMLEAGSSWVEIDPQLERRENEVVIEKQWASAFHATDLAGQLDAVGVDSLVITGLTTSGCVRATAVDGLQNEYRVLIASDAVSDRNHEAHNANLFDLQAKYADVQTSAKIIEQLTLITSNEVRR